jgi:hypothetical protein
MIDKKKLIFVSSQPIDQRNLERFRLLYLNEKFDFEYWDISLIQSKIKLIYDEKKIQTNIKTLKLKKKIELLRNYLNLPKNSFVIDISSYDSIFYILIKNLAFFKGTKFIYLYMGDYVQTINSNRVLYLFKKIFQKNYLLSLIKQKLLFFKNFFRFYGFSFSFVGGNINIKKHKGKNIIFSHSLDYNNYLDSIHLTKPIEKNYIVYIDQMYTSHPEYDFLKIPNFIEKNFFLDLELFFKILIKKYNKKIIICAHPKAKRNDQYLKNFENVVFDQLDLYTKYADLVVAHDSIGINFPIMFKKPLYLLSMPGMEITNKYDNINLMSKILGCNFIDIKNFDFKNLEDIKPVNNIKYEKYIKDYIKYGGEEINSWNILSKSLSKNND